MQLHRLCRRRLPMRLQCRRIVGRAVEQRALHLR